MKPLSQMTLAELWKLFPIILRKYNSEYPKWYAEKEAELKRLLKNSVRISHIGSTSVPGLLSKPTVDILMEMPRDYEPQAVADILADAGWLVMARNDSAKTLDLNQGYTPSGFAERVFHLHVKIFGDWGELYFRDYLRAHDGIARKYERLKTALQKRFEHDRDGYTAAKTSFVERYTELARLKFPGRYRFDK